MGLRLTVGKNDKITLSNGIVIDVRYVSKGVTQLEFHAPDEVIIHAIFADSKKQFKNLNK